MLRPSLAVRLLLPFLVTAMGTLLPGIAVAQGAPAASQPAPRYTAPESRFSADTPTWEGRPMAIRTQKPDGAGGVMVIWDNELAGQLARIDAWKAAMPTNAREQRQGIEEELQRTAKDYTIPEQAVQLESEFMPDVLGGSGYLSAFIAGGSHLTSEYEGGTEKRQDAARTALLFYRGGYLLRVAFLATMWKGEAPNVEQLQYLRAKTMEWADSIVVGALPEFSGQSQANWQLKASVHETMNIVFAATHGCAIQSIETSVARPVGQGGAGSEELWIARGCKREGRYRVALTPSISGGVDFDVSEAEPGKPAEAKPASAPAASPGNKASMALTCILNQTAVTRYFQFRWGESAAWQDSSVDPGYYRPMSLPLDPKGKGSHPKLEIRLGPSADPEQWPVFELESKRAPSDNCADYARIYLFAESEGQFHLSEAE